MAIQGGAVRLEESQGETRRLLGDVVDWLDRWDARDRTERMHGAQLLALRDAFEAVFARLEADLVDIESLVRHDGLAYARCRSADLRAAHMRRVWRWFAERFDQRRGEHSPVLAAADEVLWSCYGQAFLDPSGSVRAPSTPLAYVEPALAPRALVRDAPPAELRLPDSLLLEHLRLLPVPAVAVPPVCMERPWWLLLLAHESGHHIQHDLPGDLVSEFARNVAEAVSYLAEATAADVSRWRGWSQELFADAVAVLHMGPLARWAMGELEYDTPRGWAESADPRYPPPMVRALFMDAVLTLHGVTAEDVDADGFDARAALRIAELVGDMQVVCQPLAQLLAFDPEVFAPGGPIDDWCDVLEGDGLLYRDESLGGARRCIAGGVAAWCRAAQLPRDERLKARKSLAARILQALPMCRAPGTRAAVAPTDDPGVRLADALFDVAPERLTIGVLR